jgi:CBS domain-containing protein
MQDLLYKSGVGAVIALVSRAAPAADLEELQAALGNAGSYAFLLFVIVVGIFVYFRQFRDKRAAPLSRVFEGSDAIQCVAPDTMVTECVRAMVTEKIGALIVMDGERLAGIFTERDALNRVLAAGLDPRSTRVSEVMTKDPYCVPPTTTVGAAMELITTRQFRHLPIVENGKVLALVSSGDLTHWLL